MKVRRLALTAGLVVALVVSRALPARAQLDPRQILAGMIQQVQTGTPNPLWYGVQLWNTIAMQTGNSGVYPQLRALGVVQNVIVTQQLPLPAGLLYAMTVQHQFGQSYWVFGIGTYTNRIEYASFATGPGSTPYTLPGAPTLAPSQPAPAPSVGGGQPASPQPTQPAPQPPPSKGPDKSSEACKKFPNLCG